MIADLLDRLADRLARRCEGPTVSFTDPSAGSPPALVPTVAPPTPGRPAAAAPAWPPGAGRHADDCAFLDDPRHRCLNSYGEPIRPGGSCWHTARMESLRSFADRHPRWAPIVLGEVQ